jgi:hypothetical protein
MSYQIAEFTSQVGLLAYRHMHRNPDWAAELTVMATALGADSTTRDTTMQTAAGILRPGWSGNNALHNELALLINRGKGGNLTTAQMAAAINEVAGETDPEVPPDETEPPDEGQESQLPA